MKKEALRMDRVTYRTHNVTLLDNFNFQVFAGEVMGLIPLDSLGMDALISLLQVNEPLLYGYIYLQEELVNTFSGTSKPENNVLVISNESHLVNYMSAAENVFTLRRGYRGVMIKNKILRQQLSMLLQEAGMEIDPDKPLISMTLFERYAIELVKAVVSKPDLIVLRDPSSVINPDDQKKLHRVIRYYAGKGITFLYISAHREELVQVSDRVALMANGRIVKVTESQRLTEEILGHYTFPLQLAERSSSQAEETSQVERVFRFEDVFYKKIQGLSFSVHRGECLAIHDYGNQICDDMVRLICAEKPERGQLLWCGQPYRGRHLRKTAVILENPVENMLYEGMSYEDNLCITIDHLLPSIWRRNKMRKNIAREVMADELPNLRYPVKELSMRQKYQLIYTRILLQKPDVVFCIHPYLNVDLELQQYIQTLMKMLLEREIAVVIIMVNFQDALILADRLLLVKDGCNCGVLTRQEFEYLVRKNDEIW